MPTSFASIMADPRIGPRNISLTVYPSVATRAGIIGEKMSAFHKGDRQVLPLLNLGMGQEVYCGFQFTLEYYVLNKSWVVAPGNHLLEVSKKISPDLTGMTPVRISLPLATWHVTRQWNGIEIDGFRKGGGDWPWALALDAVVFASSAKPAQNAFIAVQVALTPLKQGEEGHFEVKPGNGAVRQPAANGMQLLRTQMLAAVLV